jgi:hypothetical protein
MSAHGNDFLEMQIEVDLQLDRWGASLGADFGAPRGEALRDHRQVVGPRGNVFEREGSVGSRHRLSAEFIDLNGGATKRGGIQ